MVERGTKIQKHDRDYGGNERYIFTRLRGGFRERT